ncbi:hypothetical protein [Bradyrhizobium erythrophlei]|uniref:Alpha/beta hydrolase family protein n=1 Tax=Bradyrhizobium erythrophlei TaxID=1437360 RepID=A0A1H5EK70_9BRAD|nr:hypothetical protein [Bradyrhizobium erythrophlei]SED91512.1 hypothetical protein SAMN05444164_6271 [Bradyrhizobium erythrophlei]
MHIKKRLIVHVQGYDPRGLAQHYRRYRSELKKFAALYGVKTKITRPVADHSNSSISSWTTDTEASDGSWQTHTHYDFLRWEDLIKRNMEWPAWRTVINANAIYCRQLLDGTLLKFLKASWRFFAFYSYAQLVFAIEAVLSLIGAFLVERGLHFVGLPLFVSIPVAIAVFVGLLGALLKLLDGRTYTLYLMSDQIFTWNYAHRRHPEWDERIEQFAGHLVEVTKKSDADELIIVGHSSGSFLGLEILSRALEIDPELGHRGPKAMLLTIGANLPIVGFLPASRAFRERLQKLAVEPSIDWVDCQSVTDVMNFYPFEPVTGHGIHVGKAQRNPRIMDVQFRDIIDPKNWSTFRRHPFRGHAQFFMANEQPNAYDFFMMMCGPVSLGDRAANPTAALTIAVGDAAAREQAWSELELPPVNTAS